MNCSNLNIALNDEGKKTNRYLDRFVENFSEKKEENPGNLFEIDEYKVLQDALATI